MTDDRRPASLEPLEDSTIEQLVREVAGGWTMPPVRLDAPGWRARVRPTRARRLAAMRGGLGRALRAATAALALTVAGALVAVVLTQPPPSPGSSPVVSPGTSPGPSSDASLPVQATPLPKLLVNGDMPDTVSIPILLEHGAFATVDLATGSLTRLLDGARDGSILRRERDGSIVCLCVTRSLYVGEQPTQVAVALVRYDAAGTVLSSTPVRVVTGEPDPRDEGRTVPEHPAHVLVSLSFSADGRHGLVGWSARAHPAWHGGVDVVDLADGSRVSGRDLPDGATGDGDARRVVSAPRVVGETTPGTFVIARSWYQWTPVTSQNAAYSFGAEAFTASFDAGIFTNVRALPGAADCGEAIERAGPRSDGGTWLACATGGAYRTVVRRLSADGQALGDVRLEGESGLIEGSTTALSADGRYLYGWHPVTATVSRIDLDSGELVTGQGALPAARAPGPLAGLGDWLAPPAAAKVFLIGAIVLSPDGSRVYAIGVRGPSGQGELGGSTGVFVFDAATLAPLDRWEPTADFTSLAVSSGGRFVYAAGLPGFEADGTRRPSAQASVTVFDAADGSVRLIAGALGLEMISFLGSPLD